MDKKTLSNTAKAKRSKLRFQLPSTKEETIYAVQDFRQVTCLLKQINIKRNTLQKSKRNPESLEHIYHLQCLGYNPKVLGIRRNRKRRPIQKRKTKETNLKMVKMLDLPDKDFKAAIITVFKKGKENILTMNEIGNLSRET